MKQAGTTLFALTLLCGVAWAQDSVSNAGTCLPGDAVSPWDDAGGPHGSEQVNNYIVDLVPFLTSKGVEFGLAPLIKSNKTNSTFNNSLLNGGNNLSRLQMSGVSFAAPSYMLWNAPGFGVNNDPGLNNPGVLVDASNLTGNQFGVVGQEQATTDSGDFFDGIIGALVNYETTDTTRLYVHRVMAAVNGCNFAANLAQFGVGSIDETGNVAFRADGFGTGLGCGLTPITANNNIFRVELASRDPNVLNIVSDDFPGGLFDATTELVLNEPTTHTVPTLIPPAVGGSPPIYIGPNFARQFVRGNTSGSIVRDMSHIGPVATDHRGAMAYTSDNCAALASTMGIGAILGRDAGGEAKVISIFGLDASANVTGVIEAILPPIVTDPTTGLTNQPGNPEFDNYHSQTAFTGGVSQIALVVDPAGNVLVSAQADHPIDGGSNWPVNFIPVARLNCNSGLIEWTMAGYNQGDTGVGGTGKPIFDAAATIIGRMVTLDNVTGGTPSGPSVSAPMFDAGGNVWFLSAIELFDPAGGPSTFHGALLRAVYDAANFSYELELVIKSGDVFHGANSNTDYMITILQIADSNSVDSGAPFSHNLRQTAHAGIDPSTLMAEDPRNSGGMILRAGILYDSDGNGVFEGCPNGADEAYQVLLYIGSVAPGDVCSGFLCGDAGCDGLFNGGDIDPFFQALGDPVAWQAAHPGCELLCVADINHDGFVNGGDIDPFFVALGLGKCP
ncbi:MAG: hypothetical protein IH986_03655 [Planctomycetes bacterium]|nr:hypothetical protein [Planctomycetota bacterium]